MIFRPARRHDIAALRMSYAARRRPVPPVHRRALGRRTGSSILLPTHHRAAKGAHEGHVREIGVETASLRGPRILEGSYPPVRAATGTLSSCALWPSWDNPRRRRRPLSLPVGPSAGLSRRAIVRLTWQNQGKRDPTPRSRRTVRTMITATQCRCARTLLRWSDQQAVERRFGEPTRHRQLRAGTSAAEREHD